MIRLLPAILSALLLGAHFLRAGQILLVLLCLLAPLLLIPRRRVPLRILQVIYLLGALEWLRTLALTVMQRVAGGEPWLRLLLIMGGVAAFTAATAWWLRGWPLRQSDPEADDTVQDPAGT